MNGLNTTRSDLLKWADQHNYPAVTFTGEPMELYPVPWLPPAIAPMKYAIGLHGCKENKEFWITAIYLGSDDMINGLSACISTLETEQTEDTQKPKTAMARERGIRIV